MPSALRLVLLNLLAAGIVAALLTLAAFRVTPERPDATCAPAHVLVRVSTQWVCLPGDYPR